MNNHLQHHEYEHKQRTQNVERDRAIQQAKAERVQTNRVLARTGQLLIKAGERLQQQAQPQPRRQRSRA